MSTTWSDCKNIISTNDQWNLTIFIKSDCSKFPYKIHHFSFLFSCLFAWMRRHISLFLSRKENNPKTIIGKKYQDNDIKCAYWAREKEWKLKKKQQQTMTNVYGMKNNAAFCSIILSVCKYSQSILQLSLSSRRLRLVYSSKQNAKPYGNAFGMRVCVQFVCFVCFSIAETHAFRLRL